MHENLLNGEQKGNKQKKSKEANKYPFPSLLLQERPDHGVQGMDVPWLVNKMNSSKSCWETILEQHGGGKKIKTHFKTLRR